MTLRVARHREALKSCCWQRLYIYIYVYIYINAYTYICIKSAGLPRIMIDAVAGQRFSGKAGIWKEDALRSWLHEWPRLCVFANMTQTVYIYIYMEDIRNIHKVYYSQTFHKLQFRYTANSCCTHHIHKLDCCESLINYKLLVITQQVLVCFSTSHFPPVEFQCCIDQCICQ